MMRPYTEYQQSDISWLGKVPKHWTKNKFKFLLNEKPKTQNLELPCGSISFGHVVFKDSERLSEETKAAYQEVLSGEFLINPLNLNYDLKSLRTALADIDVIVSSGYIVLKSLGVVDKAYLRWLLYLFDVRHMKTLGAGIRQTISFKDIADCAVYIPNDSEQKAIATFLDRETLRIDSLIEEKQTFIKLLKEKRQALISHVVTKGLNPDVELMKSNHYWLEVIPSHWKLSKIKYLAKVSNGATPNRDTGDYWNGGTIGWLNSSKVNDVYIENADQYITELALKVTSVQAVKPNDILMAITGEGQTRGRVAISKIDATINQHLAAISITQKELDPEFLHFWLTSQYGRIRYESSGAGSTKGAITCSDICGFPVPVPPHEEQLAIVSNIKSKTKLFDRLLEETNRSILLLNEHRTSLISAAVTGKIDVREAV
ncbi:MULTISPECIES: restriction endonuclease subunit S [Vibrio]|uniref:restriction endonuclease subunit S n=1 Tax=Vibrio TaxID=662 RepID=UPI001CDBE7E4|nr:MULTISPECIES: restriction endonuclease subunit S [Vibrio]MDW2293418.1 restriction endonuclease subunit S [Vibrio sp. 1404]MCA2454518.1 restriction endonuclease subunit S [Vibrio alginolyticus]MCA2461519.1 restriction endonuclease subunit S [Vibrio alginolyticus]MDW2096690.1 restriction endonuclease subunit S [Vibrio sp. 1751]MDW2240797.1 restriction endonuclease subunit S [Vibrio sp. 1287]